MFYFQEITKVSCYLVFAIILSLVIIIFSYIFSSSNPDVEKVSAYECGFDPYEDARNLFDVRFYLLAIIFIIFDLEAIYFFPWCISLSVHTELGFWGMFDFILELLIGFVYAWKIGALDWD